MIKILNIGRVLQVDEKGFIVSESDKNKIKSPWKEAVDEIKESYIQNLGESLHSIYIRGTVSRGESIEGISDIDTFAILNREIKKEDRSWFRESVQKLEEKYSFATDIELNLLEMSKILDLEEGFNDRFTLKVQSSCLYGTDLIPEINPFKADFETAKHFHRNLDFIFEKFIKNIQNNESEEDIKEWCRWVMKRILRAAFVLVMDKEKVFTRDLYPSYTIFSKYYPEKEPLMKKALDLAINPSGDIQELKNFINDFGFWVQEEIEEKFK